MASTQKAARFVPAEPVPGGAVRAGLETSLAAAAHLGELDAAGVAAMRALADKIDQWDVIVRWAKQDAEAVKGARPSVPIHDNVSPGTFLKALHEFGLTPDARGVKAIGDKDSCGSAGQAAAPAPDEPFDPASV